MNIVESKKESVPEKVMSRIGLKKSVIRLIIVINLIFVKIRIVYPEIF